MPEKFVFHGSPEEFDSKTANPKLNERTNAAGETIFNEESFHATPHKWIALAYTYTPKPIEGLGAEAYYSMGVNLYSEEKEVVVFGVGSLEESLEHLYGRGGFVYHFDNGDFIYKEGLGSQEVIVNSPTAPLHMERVEDPVKAMRELGVAFHFVDLAQAENTDLRD